MDKFRDVIVHRRELGCRIGWPELRDMIKQRVIEQYSLSNDAAFKVELKQVIKGPLDKPIDEWYADITATHHLSSDGCSPNASLNNENK